MKTNHLKLAALITTAVLVGCQTAGDVDEIVKMNDIRFNASIEQGSRTTLDDTKILWTAGDAVSIFQGTAKGTKFILSAGENTSNGTFSIAEGETFDFFGSTDPDATAPDYIALYPYNADATLDGETVATTLPTTQSYADDSFGCGAYPMIARSATQALAFKNVGGGIELPLKDAAGKIIVKSIAIKGNNGEKIAGDARIVAGDTPTITVSDTGSERVTLDCGTEGIVLDAAAKSFIIALPAIEFTKGITIEAVTANGVFKKTTANPVSIERSAIHKMAELQVEEQVEAGPVVCNGKNYTTIDEAVKDNADATEISLMSGTFALPDDLKNLKITGSESAIIDMNGDDPYRYSDVVFDNITFEVGNVDYHGFKHAGNITFNRCTINGKLFGYGSHEVYDNCTFNQTAEDYNMWTYGANADYTDCVFNGNGKMLHVYNEGMDLRTVNITRCKFISTKANKGAVNVKTISSGTPLSFNVNINDCTVEGEFPTANGGLWACDNALFGKVSIKVDGAEVYNKGYIETGTGCEIYNAAGLTWFAEQVNGGNNFSGKTVVLTDNIDLNNAEWTPIGIAPQTSFAGTFDGNGKTVSNLTVNRPEEDYNGLFGYVKNAELKNVTISTVSINGRQYLGALAGQAFSGVTMSGINVEHAEINGGHWIGGIVGHTYSDVLDCHVNDLNIVCTPYMVGSGYDNGDKVGGISGWMGSATIDKCSVTQATLKGYRDIGGITGLACKDGRAPVVTNNTVTDCTITADQTNYNYGDKHHNAGEIIGRLDTADITNENNTANNVTIEIVGKGNEVVAEGLERTADGTYNIVSAAGLKSLAELVNAGDDFAGKTIVLTDNADLGSEEWTPIGNGSRSGAGYTGSAFKGTFDGNDKTISGLKITTIAGKAGAALIGVLDGGTVKSITLDVNIDCANDNDLTAGCVGLLTNNGIVENVTVSGSVSGCKAAAGIVSRVIKSGKVSNCHNHATISGSSYNIGGIVGAAYYDNEGMTIEGCTNDGAVSGTYAVGGIAGLSAAAIKDCSNSATVTGNGTSIGGVIGEQQNAGSVTGCTNTGDVKNSSAAAYGSGGIVGWIRYSGGTANYPHMNIITVSGCENRGSVTGGNDAGGIVGTVYNYGTITANKNYAPTLSAKTFVAGVVGNVQFDTTADGITDEQHVYVTNNYSETALDNMIGSLKAKFVYVNDQSKTTDNGNTPNE